MFLCAFILVSGTEVPGETMKTRDDLNQGLDSLSGTADLIDKSYTDITDAVNLANGGLLALGHEPVVKGAIVSVPVLYFKGHSQVSGLQFDLLIPSGITFQSIAVGPAGIAAGKQIASNPVPGGLRIVVFGINQMVIGPGVLAMVGLSTSATAGTVPFSLGISGLTATDPNGNPAQITASTGTVLIQ